MDARILIRTFVQRCAADSGLLGCRMCHKFSGGELLTCAALLGSAAFCKWRVCIAEESDVAKVRVNREAFVSSDGESSHRRWFVSFRQSCVT